VSISSPFYARIFRPKFWHLKLQSFVLALRLFGAKILYKKLACQMLMKLTKGVNFINILFMLFCRYPFAKKWQSQTVIREKLHKAPLYKKARINVDEIDHWPS